MQLFKAMSKTMKFKAKDDNREIVPTDIRALIIYIRGRRVIVDVDLAHLYGVKTKRLKEQVKRNIERFPPDFMF